MDEFQMRKRSNLYKSDSGIPFNVSRSKIELFLECTHCFYLDRRLGIARPDMPGWSLNSAVDNLLKNEFDLFREKQKPHEIMLRHNIADTVPFWHPNFHIWRDDNNKKSGAFVHHKKTNLNIVGIIDDIWQNLKTKELHIVDYKSTSTDGEVSLNGLYKAGYKRQIEIYQWIFKQLGFAVSDIGYFVYANGIKTYGKIFNDKLEFKTSVIPYSGNLSWIEKTILDIKNCLDATEIPEPRSSCQHCAYRELIKKASLKKQKILI